MSSETKQDQDSSELHFKGDWWLSGSAERIRGELTGNTDDGYSLELEGEWGMPDEEGAEPPIILGETTRGDKVTLLECTLTSRSVEQPRTVFSATPTYSRRSTSAWFSHWVLVGNQHFLTHADVKFYGLCFRLPGLEAWHGENSFKTHLPDDFSFSKLQDEGLSLHYKCPNSIDIADALGIKAEINYAVKLPGSSIAQTEARIYHHARILIEPQEGGLPLYDFDENGQKSLIGLSHRICSFFSLGMASFVSPYKLIGYAGESDKVTGYFTGKTEIYRFGRPNHKGAPLEARKMLFCWSDVRGKLSSYLKAWLEKFEDIDTLVHLYLNNLPTGDICVEQRFLELIQALEGYHRYSCPEAAKKSAEHKAKLAVIHDSCPDHGEWLKGKLAHSHEPSLKERLMYLVGQHQDVATWLANDMPEAEKLLTTIVKTRHGLAHCLPKARDALQGRSRRRIILFMRTLLTVCFLSEMEVEESEIQRLAKGDWQTQRERRFCFPQES